MCGAQLLYSDAFSMVTLYDNFTISRVSIQRLKIKQNDIL